MRAKCLTMSCALAIGLCTASAGGAAQDGGYTVNGSYDNGGPLATTADALVVRPACLVATVLGSAVFVVALPWAAASGSIKKAAHTLVVRPAGATFTRPLGDIDALTD